MDNHFAVKNIQKVSLLFFIIIGALHLSSGALLFQNNSTEISNVIFKTSFIPFVICGLTYGLSSFKINYSLYNNEQENKKLNSILIGSGVALVIILTIIFFFVPNLAQ